MPTVGAPSSSSWPFLTLLKTFQNNPAMVINQMLLSQVSVEECFAFCSLTSTQYPNAKVAISHDNDWCAVIKEVGYSAEVDNMLFKAYTGRNHNARRPRTPWSDPKNVFVSH